MKPDDAKNPVSPPGYNKNVNIPGVPNDREESLTLRHTPRAWDGDTDAPLHSTGILPITHPVYLLSWGSIPSIFASKLSLPVDKFNDAGNK
jgi:hypothetical protein